MSHFAPYLVSSVVAIVALTGLILTVLKTFQLLQKQNQMIQTFSNLMASKDLAAFVTLETTSKPEFDNVEFVPMDDASVAERLAGEYSEHGRNPQHAYAQDDDPLADFGDVFRG